MLWLFSRIKQGFLPPFLLERSPLSESFQHDLIGLWICATILHADEYEKVVEALGHCEDMLWAFQLLAGFILCLKIRFDVFHVI